MKRVFNFELLAPVFVLLVISLTTLLSLDKSLFQNQLFFTFLGSLAFFLFSLIDYRVFKNLKFPIFLVSAVALFFLLILGKEARGAVRWVGFAGWGIQFSEILKPFLLASFAAFLISREARKSSTVVLSLVFVGIIAVPIFLQPDLGSTLIYVFTPFLMLLFYGVSFWWFGLGFFGLLFLAPLFWRVLADYQKDRFFSFLNPGLDPQGTSYNMIQSVITVGSGQLFGRGLGLGTQSQLRFLPERHTDFIFATISENFGFVGSVLVLSAFVFLLVRIYKLVRETDDAYGLVLGSGAFILITLQVFINIGGNLGILPITGITLPLVSYGGSSLLSNFILLGILNSISTQTNKQQKALEIK